jgi:hypothetical protein
MGKTPVRLKEVVYTLSPFQQSVMSGLWKDLPHKAAHHAANVSFRRRQPAVAPGNLIPSLCCKLQSCPASCAVA